MITAGVAAFELYRRHAQPAQQRRGDIGDPEPVSFHVIRICAFHETLEQERNRHLLLAGWKRSYHAADREPEPAWQLEEAFGVLRPDVSGITANQFNRAFPDERQ